MGSPYSSVGVVPVTTPPPVEVNAAARADGRHPFRAFHCRGVASTG
nr:hypothetical protein JVH1_0230 [Rhodococcus sp. JVH1]